MLLVQQGDGVDCGTAALPSTSLCHGFVVREIKGRGRLRQATLPTPSLDV